MNSTLTSIEKRVGNPLEGRISWGSFLSAHLASLSLVIASPATAAWSLHANFRGNIIVAGFALLVGTASLLQVAVWLAGVVTWFRVGDGDLKFSRFGRRTRSIPLSNVAGVSDAIRQNGANVWLRDGTSLYLAHAHLGNSHELAEALRETQPADPAIEGCLNRSAVAMTLVGQCLIASLLLVVTALGCLCLAVGIRPKGLAPNPGVFLYLGSVLLGLCAVGFYFAVPRFWIGCVRRFCLKRNVLCYQTVFSRSLSQRLIEDVELVSSRRSNSQNADAGTWKIVRFRDGERIKLHVGMLQDAPALFAALKAEVVRRAFADERGDLPAVTADHPLWPSIQPHLEAGEDVYWLGQPVYRKLWSEMAAEMVFAMIPGAFGAGAIVAGCLVAAKGDRSALMLAAVGAAFAAIGAWMFAAPWRCWRLLRDTVYAVTSRRVIVLRGLNWGTSSSIQMAGSPVEFFDREQARFYEIVGKGRDIALGGFSRRGRRGTNQYWLHVGFLAPDDPRAAESAIRRLLSTT